MSWIERSCQDLLNLIRENIDYLKDQPKILAYIMWKYDRLHGAGRTAGECWENPKYPVLELEKEVSEVAGNEIGNLVYDAWAAYVDNLYWPFTDEDVKPDPLVEFRSDPHKTIDDWVAMMKAEYGTDFVYGNPEAVKNHLLCVLGNGLDWNKDGFIARIGPSGVDECVFANALSEARNLMSKEFAKQLEQILNRPTVVAAFQNGHQYFGELKEKDRLRNTEIDQYLTRKERKVKKIIYGLGGYPHYPLYDSALMMTMPDNAHVSYVKAARIIAKEILSNPEERESSQESAKAFLQKWGK